MAAVPSSDVSALRAALLNAQADAARTRAVNADLAARVALLELQNEKMRRALYGQRSERGQLLVDQMELGYEELEASAGEDEALGQRAAIGTNVKVFTRARPSRKPLPAHLPRERSSFPPRRAAPAAGPISCPSWGGRDGDAGGDPAPLEGHPDRARAVRLPGVRSGYPAPAPFHATPRGMFGPSFLAMVLFEKFGTHQPLNRQRDRYAREGVDLGLSTLADQVGACAATLRPLHLLIEAHVLAAERLHGDDTTVLSSPRPRPTSGGSGLMFATTGRSQGQHRRRPCSATRVIDAPSTRSRISRAMAASCRPTPMRATTPCSDRTVHPCRSHARCAGRMPGASSSSWPTSPPS